MIVKFLNIYLFETFVFCDRIADKEGGGQISVNVDTVSLLGGFEIGGVWRRGRQ